MENDNKEKSQPAAKKPKKEKNGTDNRGILIASAIFFAVVAFCACGYIFYDKVLAKKTSNKYTGPYYSRQSGASQGSDGEGSTPTSPDGGDSSGGQAGGDENGDGYDKVVDESGDDIEAEEKLNSEQRLDAIAQKMRRVVEERLGSKITVESLNEPSIMVKIDNGTTFTLANKTMGASYRYPEIKDYDSARDDGTLKYISYEIIDLLERRGFKESNETESVPFAAPRYRNGNIICEFSTEGSSIRVGCSVESWISKDQKKFIAELAEAYKKKKGHYPGYLYADQSKIENSPIKPYQRVGAVLAGAGATFYRVSSTAEWKLGLAGQQAPACDTKFDDDLRKALYGTSCIDYNDSAAGSIGTIK